MTGRKYRRPLSRCHNHNDVEDPRMAIDLDNLDSETREAFERLRSVNMSMGAYLKIVEGALLAAWSAGQAPREVLMAKDDAELTDEERKTRTAWELVREIVLRVPNER